MTNAIQAGSMTRTQRRQRTRGLGRADQVAPRRAKPRPRLTNRAAAADRPRVRQVVDGMRGFCRSDLAIHVVVNGPADPRDRGAVLAQGFRGSRSE